VKLGESTQLVNGDLQSTFEWLIAVHRMYMDIVGDAGCQLNSEKFGKRRRYIHHEFIVVFISWRDIYITSLLWFLYPGERWSRMIQSGCS
jgi:hypothetical protein